VKLWILQESSVTQVCSIKKSISTAAGGGTAGSATVGISISGSWTVAEEGAPICHYRTWFWMRRLWRARLKKHETKNSVNRHLSLGEQEWKQNTHKMRAHTQVETHKKKSNAKKESKQNQQLGQI
jgi:hypothetical protein